VLRATTLAFIATFVALVPVGIALGHQKPWQTLLFGGVASGYLVVGQILVERRPGNRVGAVVFGLGAAIGGFVVGNAYVGMPEGWPAREIAAWSISVMDGPLFAAIVGLFLLFPAGRVRGPRWRAVAWLAILLAIVNVVTTGLQEGPFPYYSSYTNPFGVPGFPGAALRTPFYLLFAIPLLLAVWSLVVRWRDGGSVERAQIKWVAASAAVIVAAMISYGATVGPTTYTDAGDVAVGIGMATFPIAIGVAVMRYRLFEIDRLISRTIGWAIVTGAVVAIYLVAVLALQALLGGITQGETLAVAGSTLLAAALFQPLRGRIQRTVDGRFDRARFDSDRTVAAFTGRLRDAIDLQAVSRDLRTTAKLAVRPRRASIWLRSRNDSRTKEA
jgi:hypothetical protein